MPDNSQETSILIETLSAYKALEGLIHNINTPLNVIIGYTQQLKKQYPEIASLEKIYDAGLQIDDMIRSGSDSFINRMDTRYTMFDLKKWLKEELGLLKNIMEVKHSFRFETKMPDENVIVKSNTLVLGLFLDSIIFFLRNHTELVSDNKVVALTLDKDGKQYLLDIKLPDYKSYRSGIKEYLTELRNELECNFEQIFAQGNPFLWEAINEKHIKIKLTDREFNG